MTRIRWYFDFYKYFWFCDAVIIYSLASANIDDVIKLIRNALGELVPLFHIHRKNE